MRVLVTGGNGFIGRHVCHELGSRGHEPFVFDHVRVGKYGRPGEQFLGDIRDDTAVTEAVAHSEGVIHLAGVLGTQETINNPGPSAQTNIMGALNIFDACTQYDIGCVNIAVGNWFENNAYSISKSCAERYGQMFCLYRGARITTVRALNAYGPGQIPAMPFGPSKVRKIVPAFICRALANEPLEIYGDGEQIMDMIFIKDLAAILVDALLVDHGQYLAPFEAGTGVPTTVNDIAKAVLDEIGGGTVVHLPGRPGETAGVKVLADPATLKPLGDYHLTTLADGLAQTVGYYR